MPVPTVSELLLAVDVGGTKTLVGVFQPGARRPKFVVSREYGSADFESLAAILECFLSQYPQKVTAACIAVAGPVIGGRSEVTNLPWRISATDLKQHFRWSRVILVNDLAAMATAVSYLYSRETVALNDLRRKPGGNLALMAPGTGLGTALLVADGSEYHVVASEGGHVDWGPTTEEECDLWRFLHRRYGHVSPERIGAGSGLVNIFEWLVACSGEALPEEIRATSRKELPRVIAQGALEGKDPLCRAALKKYVSLLGAQAGNLVLTGMATGGLFLGGGIPPKILPALREPHFMNTFRAKGRHSGLMARVPVRVITHPRTGLLGAAICGFRELKQMPS